MSTSPLVSKESLQTLLDQADEARRARIIGRALVVLFRNQTADEQSANTTNRNNGTGFTGCDAYSGSLTAKFYIKHNSLTDWQISKWTKKGKNGYSRLTKYWRQLAVAAEAKASERATA